MTGKLKKVLLPNLPYLLFVWLFDKLCQAVRMAFRFIRTALDENRVKYEARARKNRENGLLGGRPRNPVGSWESGKSGY